jgi:hypothetical protein
MLRKSPSYLVLIRISRLKYDLLFQTLYQTFTSINTHFMNCLLLQAHVWDTNTDDRVFDHGVLECSALQSSLRK